MAFVARSMAEIRDALLANWRAGYVARGRDLDVTEDGDNWAMAEAIALEQEALELAAQEAANRVLVRSTFGEDLDAFAADEGTRRQPPSATRRHVFVTGAASTAYSIAGRTLNSSRGVAFQPIDAAGDPLTSITTNGDGEYTLLAEAQTEGAVGNLALGTTLTWSSAVSGMAATGVVVAGSGARAGEEEESDEDLQTRLIELMRERPASGNRADWRSKLGEVSGVSRVFIYPLLAPPTLAPGVGTPQTPGTLTAVVLGPAQGDVVDASSQLVIGGTAGVALPAVKGYVEGTHDAEGSEVADPSRGNQWRAVTLDEGDYTVEAVNTVAQSVTVQIELDDSASWSWIGSAMTLSSSTTTTIIVAGDQTARNSADALVFIGTAHTRGGWTKINLGTGVYAAGFTTFTFSAVASAPNTLRGCYPCPSNWGALRLAAFTSIDALAPGNVDTDAYPRSARFPPESWGVGYYARFRRLRFAADLMAVDGVLTAAVTLPVADVTPGAKTVVRLGEFLVTQ